MENTTDNQKLQGELILRNAIMMLISGYTTDMLGELEDAIEILRSTANHIEEELHDSFK